MTNKVIVYTCITKGYDKIKIKGFDSESFDYCVISDKDLKLDGIETRKIPLINNDPVRTSRYQKINPHKLFPDYEYSIWVDGSMAVIGDVSKFIDPNKPIQLLNHRQKRDGYMGEYRICRSLKKDDVPTMEKQVNGYKEEGYVDNGDLYETGVLIRKHNDPVVINVMETWSSEVMNKSRRDQLSFGYSCWKNDVKYHRIGSLNHKNVKSVIRYNIKHG